MAFALACLILTSSCSDNPGCIDANDYGEYELDSIEVSPKILAANCDVDSSVKDDNGNTDYFSKNAKHGADFFNCISSKTIKFSYFEDGEEKTESSTCKDVKTNLTKLNSCINRCKILCPIIFSKSFESNSLSYVYNKTRSESSGINIYPNSQINISVSGAVSFASEKSFPKALITSEQIAPQHLDSKGQNQVVNINLGQAVTPYFTGVSSVSSLETNADQTSLAENVAKFGSRVGVVTHPFPFNHSFSVNNNSETVGSYGLPILPDPRAWVCGYDSSKSIELCENDYSSAGYKNISDTLANEHMPPNILDFRAIRNNIEELTECNEKLCKTYEIGPGTGIDINASGLSLEENLAYNVLIRSDPNYDCKSISIDLKTKESNESFANFPKFVNIGTSFSIIENAFMAKNKNTKLIINNLSTLEKSCKFYINLTPTYLDYKVPYSGLLSMGYAKRKNILVNAGSSCVIYGRITNPNAPNSQYFEYDELQDPLTNSLTANETSWNKNSFFVRKGQVVRLDIKSFVEPNLKRLRTREVVSGQINTIDCMMGLGINIEPMPALLCLKDKSTSVKIANTECLAIYKDGMPTGCTPQIDNISSCKKCKEKEYTITTAQDPNNTAIPVSLKYKCNFTIDSDSCESSGCEKDKVFSFGEKCFRKCCKIKPNCIGTGCYSGQYMEYKSVKPVFTTTTIDEVNTITATCPSETLKHSCETDSECQNCKKSLQGIEMQAYKDTIITSPCYDFENYTGSVSAFYSKYDTNLKNKDPRDTTITEFLGAKLLEKFDPSLNYGSLSSYMDYGFKNNISGELDVETGKYLYFPGSIIKPNQNSRLRFFEIKDGSSFLEYKPTENRDNKFIKIKIQTENKEFRNGEMLETILCKQESDMCVPIKNNGKIISDYSSGSSFSVSNISGDYNYSNGKISRYTSTNGNLDCIPSQSNGNSNKNAPFINADFFCHNSNVKTYNSLQSYKLGFRFQDPDIANCYVSTNGSDMCSSVADQAKKDTNANSSTASNLNIYLQQYKKCDELEGYGKFCHSYSCLNQDCTINTVSDCKKSIKLSDGTYKVSVLQNGERIDAMELIKESCRKFYDPENTRSKLLSGSYSCKIPGEPDLVNCCENPSFYNNFCDIETDGTKTFEFTQPIAGCSNKDLKIVKFNNDCYISSSCLGKTVATELPTTEKDLMIKDCKSSIINNCKKNNDSAMCDAVESRAKEEINLGYSTTDFFDNSTLASNLNNYLQQYEKCEKLEGYGKFCPSRSCLNQDCTTYPASDCKKSIRLSDGTYKVSVLKGLLDYYQDYKNGYSKIFYGERIDAIDFVKEACRRYYDPLNIRFTNPAGTYYCRTSTDSLDSNGQRVNFSYTEKCCEQSSFYNNFCDIKQAEGNHLNTTFYTNEFTQPIPGCSNKDLQIVKFNNDCYISSSCLGKTVATELPTTEKDLIINECKSSIINSCKKDYGYYNGIKTNNPAYNSSNSSNRNGMCSLKEMIDGCEKEFYCINKYQDNTGSYQVKIKTKKLISNSISNKDSEAEYAKEISSKSVAVDSFLGLVINSLVDVIDGKVKRDESGKILYVDKDGTLSTSNTGTIAKEKGLLQENYEKIILNKIFQGLVKVCLILFVAIYGLFYLMGLASASHHEILLKVTKIAFIYLFIGSSGWYWFDKFFVTLFKQAVDYLSLVMTSSFDNSETIANAITAGDYYDKSIMFSAPDRVLQMFFSSVVHKKISALLFENLFGWAYVALLYYSVYIFILAIFSSLLLYVVAQIFISILLMLGPIFMTFLLFDRTRQFFDNWIKELIGFSFQQILLMLIISFFSTLFYELFRMSLNFSICYDSLLKISFFGSSIDILKSWHVAGSYAVSSITIPQTNYVSNDLIPTIFSVLMVVMIALLTKEFIGIASSLGKSIAGSSMSIQEISGKMQQTIDAVGKVASGTMKKGLSTIDNKLNVTSRLKDNLFDGGKIADARRVANKGKINTQKELTRGVQKDVEKYKKENAGELNEMTDEERSKKLSEVKEESLNKRGRNEMGLTKGQLEDIKSFKSSSQDLKDYMGNLGEALVSNKNKEQGLSYQENLKSAFKDTDGLKSALNLEAKKKEEKSSFEKNLNKIK